MRKNSILIFILFVCFYSFGQNKKIKIALVSQIDTNFTLINGNSVKKINFNINNTWLNFFKTKLDSTKYSIQVESMPEEISNNYFFKSYKYSDGFFKASPKLNSWFRELHSKNDVDIIVVLGRALLMNFTSFSDLNNYSYGLIQDKNWVFSLNKILTYKAKNGVILHETKLRDYSDYIRKLKSVDLSKISLDSLDINNIEPAIQIIDSINDCIGSKVCQKLSRTKKF